MSGIFHIGRKVRYRGPLLQEINPGKMEAIGVVVEDPQHPHTRDFVLYVPVIFKPPSVGRWYINPLHDGTTLEELPD